MSNLIVTVAFLAFVGLLAWVGWGLEPHWASKDGLRFMCRMRHASIDPHERTRWHDVKVAVDDDVLYVTARSRRARSLRGVWTVNGASTDARGKRRMYELRDGNSQTAVLRVPCTSRSVPVLDRLTP